MNTQQMQDAAAQGWTIVDGVIEATGDRFVMDSEAQAYVTGRADAGCSLARAAIDEVTPKSLGVVDAQTRAAFVAARTLDAAGIPAKDIRKALWAKVRQTYNLPSDGKYGFDDNTGELYRKAA